MKLTLLIPALLGTILASASTAGAATMRYVSRPHSVDAGPGAWGGAFQIETSDHGSFESFCLEMNEYISPATETLNYVISNAAKSGGVGGGVNGADTLSRGAAYLYSQFISGGLSTLLTGRAAYGRLQEAFWFLEDELPAVEGGTGANAFLSLLTSLGTLQEWKADNEEFGYGVAVMNITDATGKKKQDQLVAVSVPDGGATVALLGLSLSGVAFYQWRQSKRDS